MVQMSHSQLGLHHHCCSSPWVSQDQVLFFLLPHILTHHISLLRLFLTIECTQSGSSLPEPDSVFVLAITIVTSPQVIHTFITKMTFIRSKYPKNISFRKQKHWSLITQTATHFTQGLGIKLMPTSEAVLAELSLRSPQKLIIYNMKKHNFRIKVSKIASNLNLKKASHASSK